jgi:hypothetical protein
MAIMSLVLTALYSTFLLSYRTLFNVDESLVSLQESRAFVETLKQEIESVIYPPSYGVFKMEDRDFYGRQASSLTMTTVSPLTKGLTKIRYAIEEREGSLVITKSMASAFSPAAEENRVDLVEDVESFTLQAKYRDGWVKTWDSELSKDVPEEVKITLTIRIRSGKVDSPSVRPFSVFETATVRVGKDLCRVRSRGWRSSWS